MTKTEWAAHGLMFGIMMDQADELGFDNIGLSLCRSRGRFGGIYFGMFNNLSKRPNGPSCSRFPG